MAGGAPAAPVAPELWAAWENDLYPEGAQTINIDHVALAPEVGNFVAAMFFGHSASVSAPADWDMLDSGTVGDLTWALMTTTVTGTTTWDIPTDAPSGWTWDDNGRMIVARVYEWVAPSSTFTFNVETTLEATQSDLAQPTGTWAGVQHIQCSTGSTPGNRHAADYGSGYWGWSYDNFIGAGLMHTLYPIAMDVYDWSGVNTPYEDTIHAWDESSDPVTCDWANIVIGWT
jgi:hypothetical protein